MSQEEIKSLGQNNVRETCKSNPVKELIESIGLNIEGLSLDIVRKLKLLNERTKTFEDEKRAIGLAQAFFRYYDVNFPLDRFSEIEQRTVLMGTIFTDIGKTGPKGATPEQENLILDIYEVENLIDPSKISLRTFLGQYFAKDITERVLQLQIMGLDPDMTMRDFYNLHSRWTLEIISGGGVPPEAVAAAACHHLVEGINPEEIVGKDGRFTRYFGDNTSFDRVEKLIVVLDKYDAARRRGNKSHELAIESVRKIIRSNQNFAGDNEFETIISRFDQMVSRQK